jgi:hypothetical protein
MLYTAEEKKLWKQYFQSSEKAKKLSIFKDHITSQLKEIQETGEKLSEEDKSDISKALTRTENLLDDAFAEVLENGLSLGVDNEPKFNGTFFLN